MKYKKIAIVKLSAMGDIIHSMIALQFIKKQYPHLIIDWFVEESFSAVLETNPHISSVYTINLKSLKKDKKNFFAELKKIKNYSKNSYDLIIDAQGLIKSSLVSKLLGKNIAGFDKDSIREKMASLLYKKKVNIPYSSNAILRNAKVLSNPLDFDINHEDILSKKPFLYFKNEDKTIYEYLSEDKKNIIFVIGASWDSKMYPKDKFIKVIEGLNQNSLIVWGNEKERDIASYIEKNSNAKMMPKIDLNTLKALISKADLLIGNDTGPTHMAWALNIPSITLFGNTPAYRNTYETKINRVLKSNAKVNPLKLDRDDFSIKDIEENEILSLSKELLYESKN